MKRKWLVAATVLAVILSVGAFLLLGCAGPRHISARRFQSQYELGANQTMIEASYLGQADGKAYLSLREMSLLSPKIWTRRVVYVRLDELDPAFRDALPKIPYGRPEADGKQGTGR